MSDTTITKLNNAELYFRTHFKNPQPALTNVQRLLEDEKQKREQLEARHKLVSFAHFGNAKVSIARASGVNKAVIKHALTMIGQWQQLDDDKLAPDERELKNEEIDGWGEMVKHMRNEGWDEYIKKMEEEIQPNSGEIICVLFCAAFS